jgi:hypothetical protein
MKQFRKLGKKKKNITQEEAPGFERVLLLFTSPNGYLYIKRAVRPETGRAQSSFGFRRAG